ncbi:MAG: RDD family protein [Bdellovibrionota bacterium]|nr:RDD family protein [Bdellovibrionota bacterium]
MKVRKYILNSSKNTARFSRLIAKAVDLLIVLILAMLFYPFGLLLSLFYISLSDSLYGGQSVGKRLMGFSVISLEDGQPCSVKQSIIRNLPIIAPLACAIIPPWGIIISTLLIIPSLLFETYLLFKLDSGHRLGDVMADTTVVGNDPNRVDIRKAQESWFNAAQPGVAPCNRSSLN